MRVELSPFISVTHCTVIDVVCFSLLYQDGARCGAFDVASHDMIGTELCRRVSELWCCAGNVPSHCSEDGKNLENDLSFSRT